MKKILTYTALLVASLFLVTSCEKDEIGDAGSPTLAGEWIVKEYSLDVEELYGPYEILIYNTSSDVDSIWVENIYDNGYKVKAAKLSETTFETTNATEFNGSSRTFSISEAQVIDNDSIVFRVTIYTSSGDVYDDYLEAGYRRTGFTADE